MDLFDCLSILLLACRVGPDDWSGFQSCDDIAVWAGVFVSVPRKMSQAIDPEGLSEFTAALR